jgi:mono/diheme cytochrome c family protein
MTGNRTARIVFVRLALGTAAALLLTGLVVYLAAREPARMARAEAEFEGRAIAQGAATYAQACAGCHGVWGQGVPDVAPALNDPAFFSERLAELNYQGDLRSYIESAVASGRPVKNEDYRSIMPAWSQQYGGALRPDEIRDIVSFVLNWQPQHPATLTPPEQRVVDDGAAAAAGKAYFGSRDCLGCHGWPGRGGITGPDLAGIALRGGEQMPGVDAEGYIRTAILAPSATIASDCPPGPCPDMMPRDYGRQLSPRELEILVRYLLTLTEPRPERRREGAPAPLVGGLATPQPEGAAEADTPLARGKALYEAHCAQCHGDRGQGGLGPAMDVVLVSVDPERYARAATAHGVAGSLMPAWDEAVGGPLSTGELDDVAAYVVELARER